MTITGELRDQVSRTANFACEYCGVRETDAGGELTVDHFQPRANGGTDDFANPLYCCYRCNLYKADYWPAKPTDPVLWNPRGSSRDSHLLLLANGRPQVRFHLCWEQNIATGRTQQWRKINASSLVSI